MKRIVIALLGAVALLVGFAWMPATADVPQVDLAIDGSVLDYAIAHGTNQNVALSIENFGATKATDGVLTLTFGSGLSLGPYGIRTQTPEQLACTTAANVVTCPIDKLDTSDGSFMNVDIAAAANLPIGATPSLKLEIEPTGGAVDTDPSNNVADTTVSILGKAHLHYALSIPSTALVVNQPVIATGTVTNEGPDPAVDVLLSLSVIPQDGSVKIAEADGSPIPPGHNFEARFNVGTIAPGKSVRRSVQLTGLVVGEPNVRLLLNGGSAVTVDPNSECDTVQACLGHAALHLTVVKASGGTGSGTGTGSGAGSGSGNLADTGAPVVPTTLLGLLLIALGLACLRLGSRRPTSVGPACP